MEVCIFCGSTQGCVLVHVSHDDAPDMDSMQHVCHKCNMDNANNEGED